MEHCALCLGAGWVEEDYHQNKRCPECNSPKKIYDWFNECEHLISLTKNNKGHVSGLLIAQDGEAFSVSGENEIYVLKILKDMCEGNYKK